VSPSHEPYGEMASAYALGALDGEDLAGFRAHLAEGCAHCARALAEYREALVLPAADLREAPAGRASGSRFSPRPRAPRAQPPAGGARKPARAPRAGAPRG